MNTPFYTLAIDIRILGLKEVDDVVMRCIKLVPFIPMNGITLELWHDDSELEEQTHLITLENTRYSFEHSMFIEEQDDVSIYESVRAGELCMAERNELIKWYSAFGFTRINYPRGHTIKSGE